MIKPRTLRIFFLRLSVLLIIVPLFMSFVTGCLKKPAKSPPKSSDSEKKESPALEKIQGNIEYVIKEYEKTYIKQTAPPQIPPTKSEESEGSKKQEQGLTSNQQPDWPKLEKSIEKIHEQWNSFQSEAIKNGASLEMINDFSDTLNKLTITLTGQELYAGLLTANDLFSKTIDFEKLFKTKSPPETKEILYYGRMATYKILNDDEIGAKEAMDSALMAWETVKPQVKDTTIASKAEFSLKELNQAIKEKDPNLIKIKAQIGEKNVKDIIKSMEKSK